MNQRIDKLIEQCTVQNFSDCVGGYETFDHEKFAQLIVQECGDWIVDNAGAMEHLGPSYFAKAMQQHFGVAE
jgi:hypothetical protein